MMDETPLKDIGFFAIRESPNDGCAGSCHSPPVKMVRNLNNSCRTSGDSMKTIYVLALALFVSPVLHALELKIATADMQRLMTEYYKAEEVARQLREKKVVFQEEIEGLRLEGQRRLKQTQDLQELARNNALSASEREKQKRAFEAQLEDFRAYEVKYDDVRAQREAELQSSVAQANKKILADVLAATRIVGEREGFNLILNVNKTNPLTSDVLFSRNVEDVTERILTSLNASKPGLPELRK